jgi:DNA polymerase-3 subunit alpha
LASADNASISELTDKSEVKVCGIVAGLKEIVTKKGDRMGFVTLEDLSGSIEIVVFSDVYAQAVELLKSEEPLLVTGTVDIGEKTVKVIASAIIPLVEATARDTKRVHFRLKAQGLGIERLETLKDLMFRHHGTCKTFIHIEIPGKCMTTIRIPETFSVAPSEGLVIDTQQLFGYNPVMFE